jgi:hypothetical protein
LGHTIFQHALGNRIFSVRDWGCLKRLWYISLVLAPSGFPRVTERGKHRCRRAHRAPPHPVCPLFLMKTLLTWEAPPYGCPKCGKDIAPGCPVLSPYSLTGSPLSPVVRCPWRCSVSFSYTAAGAQHKFLSLLGAIGGRAKGSPAAEPCAPQGAPPARGVQKIEGPMDGQGKEEGEGFQRREVAR